MKNTKSLILTITTGIVALVASCSKPNRNINIIPNHNYEIAVAQFDSLLHNNWNIPSLVNEEYLKKNISNKKIYTPAFMDGKLLKNEYFVWTKKD